MSQPLLLYSHNQVPKQTSYDAQLVKFEKFRIYAPRSVRFSVSTTLVFYALSHLLFDYKTNKKSITT